MVLAKHNEAQVATSRARIFRGLTACLVTPAEVGKRVGVNPSNLANSICPLLEKASPLSVHFPCTLNNLIKSELSRFRFSAVNAIRWTFVKNTFGSQFDNLSTSRIFGQIKAFH